MAVMGCLNNRRDNIEQGLFATVVYLERYLGILATVQVSVLVGIDKPRIGYLDIRSVSNSLWNNLKVRLAIRHYGCRL